MPELSPRRRMLVLAICCMSLFIVGLDNTIVNVALPSIRNDLHASVSGLQWTIDAYTVVLASLLMLSGSTADRLGRRRTFQTGLVHLHARLAAVQPGAEPGLAGGVPDAAGGRRLDAQPGRDVDHHQHLHRPARAGPGDRRLGRRRRDQPGARTGDRRRAGRRRSAGARSSGSTSRSGSRPSCCARGSCRSRRRRARAGSIRSARCW